MMLIMAQDGQQPIITRNRIAAGLKRLGVKAGDLVMLHASVKAVGWVVGGPDMVLEAIFDVIGKKGTLIMYSGWEEDPYSLAEWPEEKQRAYLEECPAFDPARSRANRSWSILTEYLRTRPGTQRSTHPDGSFVAAGRLAKHIVKEHPLNYGYGPGSPLGKLYDAGGRILMLGAPLDTITALHYAETIARVPDKRIIRYKMPVLKSGKRAWVELEEYDTSRGIVDWPGEDYFSVIAKEYLQSGKGTAGKVGEADSYMFEAKDLVDFAVRWMECHFT